MIEKERPQLVGVAPRWTDQHHAMVGAALAVGAHVYCEKPFTPADAHAATENIGPIVGDEIEAMFAFPRGVNVHYTSRAKNAATAGPWGMEFVGTKGRVRLLSDGFTSVFVLQAGELTARGEVREWRPLDGVPVRSAIELGGPVAGNRAVVDDWLAAIAENREPLCSGFAAMKSLEMIHAVFAAGLSRGRMELPLKKRQHPLAG